MADATSTPPAGSGSTHRLLAGRERLLGRWAARVTAEVPAAKDLAHPILIDTLPALLRQLGEALSEKHPRRTATEGSTVAEEHGGERLRMTQFRIEDVMTEYRILREVVIDYMEEGAPLSREDRGTIHASIDESMMKSCGGYVLVQLEFRQMLAAIVAHDLRSPLSAAKAAASMIVRNPSAEKVGLWAARTVDNIDRVDRMVRGLLDVMRVNTGTRLKLDLEELDLVELARHTVDDLVSQYGERFVLAAPTPVRGYFAADSIRRAIENLVTNALKYGAPERPITINVRELHERCFITVHNHGAHIPSAEQETLFRAFQRRGDSERSSKEGWGIGLAQARAVAEAHGGSIAVESLPDLGTTFTIDIPRDARPYQERDAHPP